MEKSEINNTKEAHQPDFTKLNLELVKKAFREKILPELKKNKKMTGLLVSFIFLALLVLSLSLVKPKDKKQPTPTPQAVEKEDNLDKRIYVNYTHNFSVTVPEGWLTQEGGYTFIGSAGEVVFLPTDEKGNTKDDGLIAITVMPDSGGRYQLSGKAEFEKWLTVETVQEEEKRLYKLSDATLSGLPALTFVEKSLPKDPGKNYFRTITWLYTDKVFHPTKIDIFWNVYVELESTGESQKYLEDYEKIIGSFEILNPEKPISPNTTPSTEEALSLTKSFVDSKYDYKIEYPENWNLTRTHGEELESSGKILSGVIIDFESKEKNEKQSVKLEVLESRNLDDVSDWVNLYDHNYPKSTIRENVKFKNNNTVKLTFRQDLGEKEMLYFIHKKYLYKITSEATNNISINSRNIINSLNYDYRK